MSDLRKIPNAVAVLVLGIVSIPTCMCFGIVGLTCAIISLVLHSKGMAEFNAEPEAFDGSQMGMMKAGKICAIVGLILSIIYIIYYIVMITMFGANMMDMQEMLRNNGNL